MPRLSQTFFLFVAASACAWLLGCGGNVPASEANLACKPGSNHKKPYRSPNAPNLDLMADEKWQKLSSGIELPDASELFARLAGQMPSMSEYNFNTESDGSFALIVDKAGKIAEINSDGSQSDVDDVGKFVATQSKGAKQIPLPYMFRECSCSLVADQRVHAGKLKSLFNALEQHRIWRRRLLVSTKRFGLAWLPVNAKVTRGEYKKEWGYDLWEIEPKDDRPLPRRVFASITPETIRNGPMPCIASYDVLACESAEGVQALCYHCDLATGNKQDRPKFELPEGVRIVSKDQFRILKYDRGWGGMGADGREAALKQFRGLLRPFGEGRTDKASISLAQWAALDELLAPLTAVYERDIQVEIELLD